MSPISKSLVAVFLLGLVLTLLLVATQPEPSNQDSNNASIASEQITRRLSDKIASLSRGLSRFSNSSFWQNAPASDWSQRIKTQSEIFKEAGIDILGIHDQSSHSLFLQDSNQPWTTSGLNKHLSKVYKSTQSLKVLQNYNEQPAIVFFQPIKTVENKVIGSLIGIKLINQDLLKKFHYASRIPVVLLKNKRVAKFSTEETLSIEEYEITPINWPKETQSSIWEISFLVKKDSVLNGSLIYFTIGLLTTLMTIIFIWQQIVKIQGSMRTLKETLNLDLPIAEQIKHLSNLQNTNIAPDLLECSQAVRGRLEQLSQQKKALSLEIRKLQESENKLLKAKSSISHELDSAVAAPRLKSEFLSRMGDEVTTPMKSVVNMLKLLSEYPFDAEPKQLLNIAKRSTRLLVNNLNNIMDFSKLDADMLKLKPRAFSVREIIDDLSSELSHFANEKGLSLQASSCPDMPTTITTDDYRIKQIIRNLLGNALRFTKQGEVTLFADITAKGGKKLVRFTIADTGIGISPAAQKGLFDSLEQTTKLSNSSFAGRLRLIVSKMLAELMGGEIGVKSEIGQGSQFWFTVSYED